MKEKIHDLQRIRDALTQLAAACEGGGGPMSDCPILEAMVDEEALDDVLS